jgi:hypothetical protein
VNATFQEMAAHYGVAIIPTRTYNRRSALLDDDLAPTSPVHRFAAWDRSDVAA